MSDSPKETSSTTSESTGNVPALLLEQEGEHNNEGGNTLYKYRDFSTMPEEPDAEDDSKNDSRNNLESSIRVQKFPVKLYAILAQKEFHDIITWMPHGRSWKVLKPNLFESMVMPLFFEYSNYHSFNRLVNAWSFRRISSGPDRGSYYHELFLRGKPHLQKYMRRLPKTHKKLPMKKEDEPDFYKMDKERSLPPLEEIPLTANPKNAAVGMNGLARGGAGAGTQPLAFTPVNHRGGGNAMGLGGARGGMFGPEGVGSSGVSDFDDGYGMPARGGSRSPILGGGPGMRDPTSFGKSMEFKPVDMDPRAMGMGSQMGAPMGASQMMGSAGMGAAQGMMGSQMMGSQMAPQMMGSMGAAAAMDPRMGMGSHQMGAMDPRAMGMDPRAMGMGSQMGAASQMMGGGHAMASQMMNPMAMGQGGMGSQMGAMGAAGLMGGQGAGTNSQQYYNMQRLRQVQQMQLYDRQMAGAGPVPVGGGGDGFDRMGSYPRC